MIQRGEYFRFALKARESVVIGRQCRRQDLDRDLALQLRVCRPVDLSHAAFANLRGDFVDAEARAGDESQWCGEYRGRTGLRTGTLLSEKLPSAAGFVGVMLTGLLAQSRRQRGPKTRSAQG